MLFNFQESLFYSNCMDIPKIGVMRIMLDQIGLDGYGVITLYVHVMSRIVVYSELMHAGRTPLC